MNPHPRAAVSDDERNVDAGELDKFATLAHQWWDPESAMFSGELEASDTRASVALTAPADDGLKVTVKVMLPLAVRVAGKVRPLTEKLAFETLAAEILTVVPPVLVTVSDRPLVLPTATLPKERLAGLAASAPPVTPVPESATFNGELDASDTSVSVPLAEPARVGTSFTVNVAV